MALAVFCTTTAVAQENDNQDLNNDIQTVFKGGTHSITGYGAITNKFTYLGGEFANLVGAYGGVYINHQFMIGAGAAAMTNNLSVPFEYSTSPLRDMSYEYGQVGLIMEFAPASNKAVHLAFSLFSGAGFTLQHERTDWDDHDNDFDFDEDVEDENWFFVLEPGIQFEVNVFKWMRFSPGISYRAAFQSDGLGMRDSDVSNVSYNATLKFGRF